MKAVVHVELEKFVVPETVVVKMLASAPVAAELKALWSAVPLSSLSAETLDALCQDFTKAVFKKAGVTPPPREAPPLKSHSLFQELIEALEKELESPFLAVDAEARRERHRNLATRARRML